MRSSLFLLGLLATLSYATLQGDDSWSEMDDSVQMFSDNKCPGIECCRQYRISDGSCTDALKRGYDCRTETDDEVVTRTGIQAKKAKGYRRCVGPGTGPAPPAPAAAAAAVAAPVLRKIRRLRARRTCNGCPVLKE